MKKTVLILDGDSIAYRCSAAGEERSISVKHTPTGITKSFKHRTEFKTSMKDKGKEITEDYLVEDCQTPEPLPYVLNTINRHIERITDAVNPDEIIIFTGEENNFRIDLPLPVKYKGNRTGMRPVHLQAAKEYLQKIYNAKSSNGWETDDSCSIAAYDALRAGNTPVMYFYEKDQYQLDGVTLLHDKEQFELEVVPELGNLRLEKTAVKGLGLKFLAWQWCCSDSVDVYCAYDLSKVKSGPKTVYNCINPCETPQDVLLAIKALFKKYYPEPFDYKDWKGIKHKADWKSMLELYYKCARMKRSEFDNLEAADLFASYGVDLDA